MSRFIESLKLLDGQLFRLTHHQKRIVRTFKIHFSEAIPFQLEEIVKGLQLPEKGLYKIRILYTDKIENIEIQPYIPRIIKNLKLVNTSSDASFFKSEIRDIINDALTKKGECDDILMVNKGLLTDSSYANIALFDGKEWFTPRKPYLYGTNRDALIDKGLIIEKDIPAQSIYDYKKIRIFNALVEFGDVEIEINRTNIQS